MIQIFDTHAHYDDESFDDDRERLLAGFPAQGVHAVTNIGTNIRASEETVRMTEKYENLYGVVGIFPSEVADEFGKMAHESGVINDSIQKTLQKLDASIKSYDAE